MEYLHREYFRTYDPDERPQCVLSSITSDRENQVECFVASCLDEEGTIWIVDCWTESAQEG